MNRHLRPIRFALILAGSGALTPDAFAFTYLAPAEVDATKLLPPPPADNSKQTYWSYQELLYLQKTRTKAELDQAKADSETKSVAMFRNVLGPTFDLTQLPLTAALFKDVRQEEKAAVKPAKAYFHRTRPWALHPELKSCHKGKKTQTSYPSGHTTMAYSMGVILARLIPEKSQAILARAANYAEGRLICGQHYRRDIMAGEAFGTAIGIKLMANPQFAAKMGTVKQELVRAQLTKSKP